MASKTNEKEIAQILYLQGFQQQEIALKVGVSKATVCKWAREGNWETLKKGLLNSKKQRLAELYEELKEFNRMIRDKKDYKVANSREADARRKLITDIRELETRYSIAQTTTVARDFCEFVKLSDFELAQRIVEYFDAFINKVIEQSKWQEE